MSNSDKLNGLLDRLEGAELAGEARTTAICEVASIAGRNYELVVATLLQARDPKIVGSLREMFAVNAPIDLLDALVRQELAEN